MRTRALFSYMAAGAAVGVVAGLTALGAWRTAPENLWLGLVPAAISGAAAATGGAIASRSIRLVGRDGLAGLLLGCGVYLAAVSAHANMGESSTAAGAYVMLVLLFSASVGFWHAMSLGGKAVRLPAAFFSAIGGLIGLAATAGLTRPESGISVPIAALSGALFGLLLWSAAGAAVRLFATDVTRFRV